MQLDGDGVFILEATLMEKIPARAASSKPPMCQRIAVASGRLQSHKALDEGTRFFTVAVGERVSMV